MTVVLAIGFLIIAAVDWFAVAASNRVVEAVAKPAVMVVLIALAASRLDGAARWWIIVALAFGLLGDLLLLPHVDNFIGGLASFLAGHVAYVVAFVIIGVSSTLALAIGVLVAVALATALGRPILGALSGSRLRTPVGLYVTVIAGMVATGIGTATWLTSAGVVSFALSDGLLGHDRFVTPRDDRRVFVHVLYHLGQAAIVLGV